MTKQTNLPMFGKQDKKWLLGMLFWALIGMSALHFSRLGVPTLPVRAASGGWPTYLANNDHQSFNADETIINPASASHLKIHWTYTAGGSIASQPVEANGLIYWGSWDGYEHATRLNGTQVWQQKLGKTVDSSCFPSSAGVTSTATVTHISIGGNLVPVVFVGGGNAIFYALNANSGGILWQTRLGSSPSHFIWSSPTIYKGSIYIGLSSFGDCPLVQGQLIQMDTTNGHIQHIFKTVPDGCVGAGVWGSPTVDSTTDSVYFATGNGNTCSSAEPYQSALVKLRASDLTYMSSWQVPVSEQISDGDFGSTPVLFHATIGGIKHNLISILNKNGRYYVLDRGSINKGPIWQVQIAQPGTCPQCGAGNISPSAWDGNKLYVAGGPTSINGNKCLGSLRTLDPATGGFIWQDCLKDGPVLGAVSVVPGVAVVGEGNHLVVVATATGKTLFEYAFSSIVYAAASISHGVIYIGNTNGTLYAFGT